jgi:hypothetical protein
LKTNTASFASEGIAMLNLPSKSVIALTVEFLSVTETPGNGTSDSSITTPVIVLSAEPNVRLKTILSIKKSVFMAEKFEF